MHDQGVEKSELFRKTMAIGAIEEIAQPINIIGEAVINSRLDSRREEQAKGSLQNSQKHNQGY
jgi:hypothetical protein